MGDMKEASKDMVTMNDKIKKKNKQVKFQIQENEKKTVFIEKLERKADILEMDNYMLKDQMQSLLDLSDE